MALVEDAKQEIVFSYLSVGLHYSQWFSSGLYRARTLQLSSASLYCCQNLHLYCMIIFLLWSTVKKMSFLLFYENQQKITADSWCFSVRKVSDKNRCTQAHTLSLERIQSHCLLVGLSRLQNYLSLKRSDNNKDAPNDWIRKHIRTWKVQWFKS
jgi:hypothetical protein